MDNTKHTVLASSIANSVYSHSFSHSKELHEKSVAFMRSEAFLRDIEVLVSERDYSAYGIFQVVKGFLNSISPKELDNNFLRQVYFYTLEKSFPEAVTESSDPELENVNRLYLNMLKQVCEFQKHSTDKTWQSKFPLLFLTTFEEGALESPLEYKRFVKAFRDQYIYEMMKLNQEILKHDTLDHICGVHHVAMHVGRQLKAAGHPIDLGRVCGAAAGHDIGKYGCKPSEAKRVPYLHYYYTDLWFSRNDIPYIGHIAVNHSAWDLELENLPIESLILIYADFRVKGKAADDGSYKMHVYNLKESFDVILNKLDNVDEAKEKRYRRVYSKLKDFEDFMEGLGIDTCVDEYISSGIANPERRPVKAKDKRYYSLMSGGETVRSLKHLSISHNINLLHQLRDEASLNSILDLARSESDWKKLREYIRMLSEYSAYLTQKQKLLTLRFLYDFLTHPEDDIRRQCAELIGFLIANFDEDYRKEIPVNVILPSPNMTSQELFLRYFELFLYPDHKIVPLHRSFIGYSLSTMVQSLFKNLKKASHITFKALMCPYFENLEEYTLENRLHLLEVSRYIPYVWDEKESNIFLNFILNHSFCDDSTLKTSAIDCACSVVSGFLSFGKKLSPAILNFCERIADDSRERSDVPAENFLLLRMSLMTGNHEKQEKFGGFYKKDHKKISDIYLDNLKTATPWVLKRSQINMLLDYAAREPQNYGFYTAMHFCNILKVSAMEKVRNAAGEALVCLLPQLSMEQRNDVSVELLRALEIEGYQYAEYIPDYLGRAMLYLQPKELEEILDDFVTRIKVSSSQVNSLLLKTLGVAIINYDSYRERYPNEPAFESRKARIMGMLLNGLVNYDTHVKQVAFGVIGSDIFGSKVLGLGEKLWIFSRVAKKLLTLISESGQEELLFLTNSASLNHLYRFISDYIFETGGITVPRPKRAAFFPGAFDPFSLGHKEIANAIRDMDFEVFLSVDEFSWSKSTLPNLIRKNIINMSIANELDIYLYPEHFQTNIANPDDLRHLRTLFPETELYLVMGSDVLVNASAYRNEYSSEILSFSHIIFDRRSSLADVENEKLNGVLETITGDVVRLSLPPQLEDISSTQIRNYIDENRDISMLLESTAQKYIYDNGFYQREPQFKTTLDAITLSIKVIENATRELLAELASITRMPEDRALALLYDFMTKPSHRILIVRETGKDQLLGFTLFHRLHSTLLYKELANVKLTEFIRKNATGKTLFIDGIYSNQDIKYDGIEQILVTETLAYTLAKDYEFAIFNPISAENPPKVISEVLRHQGFLPLDNIGNKYTLQYVSMSRPCTIILDIEALIKEAWRSNKNFKKVVQSTRTRLQEALCKTTPGNLILSFDRAVLWESLIKRVCSENFVTPAPTFPRKLGPYMCAPYGDILNKSIVPNTVTKSIHTEKTYTPDMSEHKIRQFPYYLDLPTQLKMLKSFNRPVILVDDLLDRGFRLQELDPLMQKSNIEVKKIIVGILSGKGKELMEIRKKDVDSVYYIPKLSIWYNEKNFYPFLGGFAIHRGNLPERNMIPSINHILPYCYPDYLKNYTKASVYNLSMTAMENAYELLTVLEEEYQSMNERSLTLSNMGQVLHNPRCPDHGISMDYDMNLSPSHFLRNDIEHLKRLGEMIF